MEKTKPTITIKSAYNWTYYQWFILGLYELHEIGEIVLRFQVPLIDKLLLCSDNDRVNEFVRKVKKKTQKYSPLLWGEVQYSSDKNEVFCIDYDDSPYMFSIEGLKKADLYFKLQCPKNLDCDYFELTDKVHIPWTAYEHVNTDIEIGDSGERKTIENFNIYKSKIRPLMVGPRRLGNGIGYRSLKKEYSHYIQSRKTEKLKKIMCYFGDSQGPVPSTEIKKPDLNREKEIMGYWKGIINHPNEKRAIVADIISDLGDQADARVIHWGNSDVVKKKVSNNEIPLSEFCEHISNFEYNVNVSGYRLSIPGRFCESFMVGTGIVTDKLSVRWYAPFDQATVIETTEMGYIPLESVKWEEFKNTISHLPEINGGRVIDEFEKKWAPICAARYMVNELINNNSKGKRM